MRGCLVKKDVWKFYNEKKQFRRRTCEKSSGQEALEEELPALYRSSKNFLRLVLHYYAKKNLIQSRIPA